MSTSKVTVPDFDFTAFYYPQLLEAGIRWLRNNVPEISSETPTDPAIQLIRAYALMAHLNNVLLDQVAHEAMFPTAQLRDSLVQHLKLIGFKVNADVPATVDVLVTLPKSYSSGTTVIANNTTFATKKTANRDPIVFETQAATSIDRTDQVTSAFHVDASSGTKVDLTTALNTDLTPATLLPATPAPGDAFYICHANAMTNRLKFEKITTPMANVYGVWEFCDTNLEDALADDVSWAGGASTVLTMGVDGLLDTDGTTRFDGGLTVRVYYNQTGTFEDCAVQYDAALNKNYITTSSLLGQSSPSTTASDYTVGSNWHMVEGLADDTNDGNTTMEKKGSLDFIVPQTATRNWTPLSVSPAVGADITAFWLRFRVTHVSGGPVAPVIGDRIRWDKRDNFVLVSATQGQTRTQDPLASSDASESQSYSLSTTPVIEDSVKAYVDGVLWTQVDNFLASSALDNHYTTEIDSDGKATIEFGDGINGKIPPAGVNNIKAVYRTGADLNGNVGSNTIIINRSGSSNAKKVTNPRTASGWAARRGSTDTDRTLLKVQGPASIRTLERAVTTADIEYLTTQFKTSDGRTPFVRAKAIEEFYGPKTVGLFVVGTDGATTTIADREELEVYFNGDLALSKYGVLVVNQEVRCEDYTPVTVNVACTTTGGVKSQIETAIKQLIGPTKVQGDGITYIWEFGQDVPVSKIISAVLGCEVDTGGVLDVTVTTPAATVAIADNQLPVLGTLTVTVT